MLMLARKPGALRNGAPFKDWVLPAAIDRIRRKLAGAEDGDRQMVKILTTVLSDGKQSCQRWGNRVVWRNRRAGDGSAG